MKTMDESMGLYMDLLKKGLLTESEKKGFLFFQPCREAYFKHSLFKVGVHK